MKNIWIISDTHFHHENILKFKDNDGNLLRGSVFSSIEEMDEALLENWNSVVKPGDIVYHLGDVMMGSKERFKSFWPKLNGSKRLVVGNHDDIKFLSSGSFFSKVLMWRMMPEHGILMTHVPVHNSSLRRGDTDLVNVHGHIHHNKSPTEQHFNVSVEAIDYTPIHLDDLKQKIKDPTRKTCNDTI